MTEFEYEEARQADASGMPGFLPPVSLDAEYAVLGAVLADPESIHRVTLNAEDFSAWAHQAIWKVCQHLTDRKLPLDAMTVAGRLEELGQLAEVGGIAYFAHIMRNTVGAGNIVRYAEIVAERAAERRLLAASASIAELAVARDGRPLAERHGEAMRLLDALASDSAGDDRRTMHVSDAIKATLEWIDDRMRLQDGEIGGLPTGLGGLDQLIDGLHPGQLIVIGGRPSMGKSVLAEGIQRANLIAGKSVRLQTFEMPARDMALRQISAGSGIPLASLKSPRGLSRDDYNRMTVFVCQQNEYRFWLDEDSSASAAKIAARARAQKRRSGLDLLVVDHLHLMQTRGDNRAQALGDITSAFKRLALELEIPVILVAQLNRESAKGGGRRPALSDLRDSGTIEQDADVVVLVHRDSYYDEQAPQNEGDLIVAKNRNGEVGTVRVGWNGACVRFQDSPPLDWNPRPTVTAANRRQNDDL